MRKERLFNNLFDYIDFNPDANVDCKEGRVKWNDVERTIDICTGWGPVIQTGHEDVILVFNDTAETLANGSVIYPAGQVGGIASVALANATTFETLARDVAIMTMDVPAGETGLATTRGNVRGFDTSHLTAGFPVYVGLTPGALTSTRPEFPNYPILVGGTAISDAVDGEIIVQKQGQISDTFNNFWNGTFRESINFTVSSDGATITGTLEPANGHDDMTLLFSDGFTLYDTSPADTITLTAGTDDTPAHRFIYILASDKTQMVDGTDWPTAEHVKVADVVLRTAATTQTDGALVNRNWNDHIEDTTTFQGHLSHITEKLRQFEAQWKSGTEATVTIDNVPATSTVYVDTTAGVVYQLHRQVFPAQDMPTDDIHIVNNLAAPYVTETNLGTQELDADGNSLLNSSFSFVIWGVQNRSGTTSHLMCNLPTGSYTRLSPEDAVADATNFSVYDIPTEFQGKGFLIARLTFQLSPTGDWTLYDNEDLRGKIPNVTAGGGGGGGTGVSTFLALTDTPNAYTSSTLRVLQENAAGTALEFTSSPTIDGTNFTGIPDGALDETYLKTDGTRAMTGNLDMGATNNISGDDLDISAGTGDYASTGTAVITNNAVGTLKVQTVAGNPTHRGLIEAVATTATPLPDAVNAGIASEIASTVGDVSTGDFSIAGFFNNVSTGAYTQSGGVFQGLFGGCNTVIDVTTTFANRSFSSFGLQFTASNEGDIDKTSGFAAVVTTEGLDITSVLGFSGKTISGAQAQAINAGGCFTARMEGDYNATLNTGENYGLEVSTVDSLTDIGTGATINSYGLHITAAAPGGGHTGTLNSWGIYVEEGILLREQSAVNANKSGSGQLWVKDNAGTQELWFTDDASNSTQLA